MDIEIARTFLAIMDCGNFVGAAQQLNLTQSTISLRVRNLEDTLGRALFVRNKSGATPTSAGILFQKYALTLVKTWEQARQEVSLPDEFSGVLTIGGQLTLWDNLILKWIPWMQSAVPDFAIRAEVGLSEGLMRRLSDGLLDIGVMYSPLSRPGMVIEELFNETLVLVSSDKKCRNVGEDGYVYVDWGPDFRANYSAAFPDLSAPALTVSHAPLGLQHILENGGSGYFPLRFVNSHVKKNQLFLVPKSPTFSRPAYVVYFADRTDEEYKTAIQGLKYIVSVNSENS
ncbi:MAG: LysR family transcriptional regulator [Rhodospirillales bacterium]|nr:LysR family transcriptional regulator [Rhodospirillales bacterium]